MIRCHVRKECLAHYTIANNQPCSYELSGKLWCCSWVRGGQFEPDDMLTDGERDGIDTQARTIRAALEWWWVLENITAPAAR